MTIVRTPFADLPTPLVTELADAGLDPRRVYDAVVEAVEEDLPDEDVTTEATVPADASAWADVVARADGVVAGTAVAELVLRFVAGTRLDITRKVADGDEVAAGDVVLSAHGQVRALLIGERTALNYLCHLSGIASTTRSWVSALEGIEVRDTRKTTPRHRALEKYAVRCGGGTNHRTSLSDQAVVKANHARAAGGVVEAYTAVRQHAPERPVQVEATSLEEVSDLLAAGAEQILLSRMDLATMHEVVQVNAGRATLEAAVGLDLETAREIAATGVPHISAGALTHCSPWLDLAMDLRREEVRP
jgi:nicotinate-nucleotide pyrophosphorylase (carboxylating)